MAITEIPEVEPYWAGLARLWERSTGGSGVAEAPSNDADRFWPQGPSAPAASELVEWLLNCVESGDSPSMLFLVGGPGNGKSALAMKVKGRLSAIDSVTTELAQRTYEYASMNGHRLVLVNDATIPPNGGRAKDSGPTPLIDEIDESLKSGSHLLANINRGILFEELASRSQATEQTPGSQIAGWLSERDRIDLTSNSMSGSNSAFVKFTQTASPSGEAIRVIAVYMDVCSLCEVRPSVEVRDDDEFSLSMTEYQLTRFSERQTLDAAEVPALSLLAEFVAGLDIDREDVLLCDPIAANLESLRSDVVRGSVVTAIRAGELSSGKRLTYRELWGAYCRLVVGDLPQRDSGGAPLEWLTERQPPKDGTADRFRSIATLASLRFHQALFGARPFDGPDPVARAGSDPVLAITRSSDPAKDARPGSISDASGGWSDATINAFGFRTEGDSPLETLLESCDDANPFRQAVTIFDHQLDSAFVAVMDDSNSDEKTRRRIESWYGEYLLRLYGTAVGRPAFFQELSLWSHAWKLSPANIPAELKSALRTLLQPRRAPEQFDSSFVLPLFDARAVPVTGNPEDPRLGFVAPDLWTLRTARDGDALEVRLMQGDSVVETIQLDFPMIREAMACSDGYLGITEYSHSASPRLERFRASMLRPSSEGGYVIVVGHEEFQLTAENSS